MLKVQLGQVEINQLMNKLCSKLDAYFEMKFLRIRKNNSLIYNNLIMGVS